MARHAPRGLGRRVPEDRRHIEKYPFAGLRLPTPATVERALPLPPYRQVYDQGHTHGCVGYSSTWMMSLLNRRRYDPVWLWDEAKRVDPFADTRPGDRSETTVRAALDVLRDQGHLRIWGGRGFGPRHSDGIAENRWATTVDQVRTSLGRGVPVVLGIDWYASFDVPQRQGRQWWIGRGKRGKKVGGHAVCIYRASDRFQAVGIVNIAGDGVITVAQAAALVGRPIVPIPLPAAGLLGTFVKRSGLADFSSDQMRYLAHGRGLDTTRMREVLRFDPAFTTKEAFLDFAGHVRAPLPGVDAVGHAVQGAAGSAAMAIAHVWAVGRRT